MSRAGRLVFAALAVGDHAGLQSTSRHARRHRLLRAGTPRRTADGVHGDALGGDVVCAGSSSRLERLADWALRHDDPVYRDVVSPLASALMLLVDGRASGAADRLAALLPQVVRLGGSDAQREVVEDTSDRCSAASRTFQRSPPRDRSSPRSTRMPPRPRLPGRRPLTHPSPRGVNFCGSRGQLLRVEGSTFAGRGGTLLDGIDPSAHKS